jgi:ribosome biogenesis GTPase
MTDLKRYGYMETDLPREGCIPGRVIELRRERYVVVTALGEVTATLKGAFYHQAVERADFPCVGDFVGLEHNSSGVSRIAELLPRRSMFSRADFSGHAVGYVKTILEQVVAANFDYVFIVSSLNADFNVNRILRYLTQARQSGGKPVVILTKADLVEDCDTQLGAVKKLAPDVPALSVSAYTGLGLEGLKAYLQPGKTIVFLGMSGVGKSSLLNALMNREVMEVRSIREDDSRGRHTTTHRQLFMLPSGAMVVDTPGMRELGLLDADEGISQGFADVEALFNDCRFADCRHQSEPGCAVTAALKEGSLPRERWESYLAQRRENKFVDDKAGYLREKGARNKSIAMQSKEMKKKGGAKNWR